MIDICQLSIWIYHFEEDKKVKSNKNKKVLEYEGFFVWQ